MAIFMTQFSYTAEAWASLAQHPQDRSQVLAALRAQLARPASFCGPYGLRH